MKSSASRDVKKNTLKNFIKENQGLLYVMPWIIGFTLFGLFPLGMSVYLGFTEWPIIGDPKFIGMQNFINIFNDPTFYVVVKDTLSYAVFSIVLGMTASFFIAMLLNTEIKGLSIYRTIFYLPAVVSGVAVAMMWRWILDPKFGLLNQLLANFGITGPNWLGNTKWILPSYIMIAIWGAGGGMLTYLVGLKDIPQELYESATIDGAGWWPRLVSITLPMMTPILFYNMIMNIIGSLRQFNTNYILGGKQFYMLYVYNNAFKFSKMGYASALAWVLVLFILFLTLIVFKSFGAWVYYEYENKEKAKKVKKR